LLLRLPPVEDGVNASAFARIPSPEQEESAAPNRTGRAMSCGSSILRRETEPAARDCGTLAAVIPKALLPEATGTLLQGSLVAGVHALLWAAQHRAAFRSVLQAPRKGHLGHLQACFP
jgi:hypothetical protein